MVTSDSHRRLMQSVDRQKEGCGILHIPYFLTLQNGEMSRALFESTQQQFLFAVSFFSRAMAALAARIPDSQGRLPLIQNLAEEHGLTDADEALENAEGGHEHSAGHSSPFQPALAHDQTFRVFLTRLGISTTNTAKWQQERPAVRAFNLALWGSCATDPPATAFACLGAIEYAFADISAWIGRNVVARGWMSHEELVHYKLHAEVDQRHASDFFSVVVDHWARDDAGRHEVESGIALGLYLFKRLYNDLLAEVAHDRP